MTYDPHNPLLHPKQAKCPCGWNLPYPDEAAAAEGLRRHIKHRHPTADAEPATTVPAVDQPVPQLSSVDWWNRAVDTIAAQPAGSTFTLYEVCAHLDEPPTSNGWQNLARDAKHLGLIEKVGGVESKRPGTRQSMTGLWQRTHLNPTRHRRTG